MTAWVTFNLECRLQIKIAQISKFWKQLIFAFNLDYSANFSIPKDTITYCTSLNVGTLNVIFKNGKTDSNAGSFSSIR